MVEVLALRQSSMYMNSNTSAKTVGELREIFSWIMKLWNAKERVCTLVSKKACLIRYRPLSLKWEGSNCWNLAHESAFKGSCLIPNGENNSSITEKYISQTSWVWPHNIWIRSCSIKKHIFEGEYSHYRSSNIYCSRGLNVHLLLLTILTEPCTASL